METLIPAGPSSSSHPPAFSCHQAFALPRPKVSVLLLPSPRKVILNLACRYGPIIDETFLIEELGQNVTPNLIQRLPNGAKPKGIVLSTTTPSVSMLRCLQNGLCAQAQALWIKIVNGSVMPSVDVVSCLMDAYATMGHFKEIIRIVDELTVRDIYTCGVAYSLAVSCFGKFGQLKMMEDTVEKMASKGFKVDSGTGNAFVKFYSYYGSLWEMEGAYQRLKKSRILIEKEAIQGMASAYIRERKFYKLGEFLKDVGLGRRNMGNLLWNLLLLSYAVNFKMKSLQREFLNMLDAGFLPDLTTFNIRALAFSRMCLLWDLHLSIEHMKHYGVTPDLVTFGCFVDAYLERRLGKNLSSVLDKMNAESAPIVLTDPLVFEAFGKGDFHSSSEALLASSVKQRQWTYSKLVGLYLRKQYRSNQVFWNY